MSSNYIPHNQTMAAQISSQNQAAREQAQRNEEIQESMRQAQENEKTARNESEINFRYTGAVYRNAWVLTTERRKYMSSKGDTSEDYSPLYFNVNPASYQFDNPFRQNVVQAKGGPVVHTFRDPHNNQSNLGFPTINIEMSSGSLMPRATVFGKEAKGNQHWRMSPNVGNFYKWLEIIQEDTVYERDGNILPNYQIIEMSTVLFPHLTLKGYFTQNANWSENAENPNEVQNWQVQFLIYETFPSLKGTNLSTLYNDYEREYNEMQLDVS